VIRSDLETKVGYLGYRDRRPVLIIDFQFACLLWPVSRCTPLLPVIEYRKRIPQLLFDLCVDPIVLHLWADNLPTSPAHSDFETGKAGRTALASGASVVKHLDPC
jgi:hypothetical protein